MHRRLFSLFCPFILILLFGFGGGGGSAEAATPTPTLATSLPVGWTRLADMPAGVAKFGVAALGAKIYVVGGYDTRTSVMVYDIATDRWSVGPAMPRGTDNVAAVANHDKLYAMGGEASTAFQVFESGIGKWSAGPNLPRIGFASAAAAMGGRMHLVGGWNYSNTASASVASHSVFDPATQSWSVATPLAVARNAAGAAAIEGRLYVVGGRSPGIRASDQQSLASMEIYSPLTDQWQTAAPLPTARGSLAVVALAGRLYALGGESTQGKVSDAVERYDPASQSWSVLPAMPFRSHGLGAVVVGGAMYVIGGFTGTGDAVGSESVALYKYQP
jgi:N-acetylneuraminic acid mutarotase